MVPGNLAAGDPSLSVFAGRARASQVTWAFIHVGDGQAVNAAQAGTWLVRAEPTGVWTESAGRRNGFSVAAEDLSLCFSGSVFQPDAHGRAGDSLAADPATVVLTSYRQRGTDGFARLRGTFAFVLLDRARRLLVAACDPLGTHPLFFGRYGERWWFSDSVGRLRRQDEIGATFNAEYLAAYHASIFPPVWETCFSGIRRVPPAHALLVSAGTDKLIRCWMPTVQASSGGGDPAQFDALLRRAVRRCRCYGVPAVFLSGGVDSVSIAAAAAEQDVRPLALSLGFPAPDCNEEQVQRGVAQALGLEQVFLPLGEVATADGLLRETVRMHADCELPTFFLWAPGYAALAQRARERGYGAILTGNGGDDWLGVGPYLAADLMRRLDLRELLGFFRSYRRSFGYSTRDAAHYLLWQHGARALAGNFMARMLPAIWAARRARAVMRAKPPWIAPDPRLSRALRRRAEEAARQDVANGDLNLHQGFKALGHTVVTEEIEYWTRFGAAHNLHVLHPYWDPDLIEYLMSLPPQALSPGGIAKGLARQSLVRRFPDLGFHSRKKVLASNYSERLLATELPPLWRTMGGPRRLAEMGVVDLEIAGQAVLNRRTIHSGSFYRLSDLLGKEAWLRAAV